MAASFGCAIAKSVPITDEHVIYHVVVYIGVEVHTYNEGLRGAINLRFASRGALIDASAVSAHM